MMNSYRSQRDGLESRIKTWASFLAYPVAIYRVGIYEWQLLCTATVKDCLEYLSGKVRRREPLRDQDVTCLTDNRWDAIPWSKL